MNKLFTLIMSVAITSSCIVSAYGSPSCVDLWMKAKKAHFDGNIDRSIKFLTLAIEKTYGDDDGEFNYLNDSSFFYIQRAQMYHYKNEIQLALNDLQHIIDIKERDGDIRNEYYLEALILYVEYYMDLNDTLHDDFLHKLVAAHRPPMEYLGIDGSYEIWRMDRDKVNAQEEREFAQEMLEIGFIDSLGDIIYPGHCTLFVRRHPTRTYYDSLMKKPELKRKNFNSMLLKKLAKRER